MGFRQRRRRTLTALLSSSTARDLYLALLIARPDHDAAGGSASRWHKPRRLHPVTSVLRFGFFLVALPLPVTPDSLEFIGDGPDQAIRPCCWSRIPRRWVRRPKMCLSTLYTVALSGQPAVYIFSLIFSSPSPLMSQALPRSRGLRRSVTYS